MMYCIVEITLRYYFLKIFPLFLNIPIKYMSNSVPIETLKDKYHIVWFILTRWVKLY